MRITATVALQKTRCVAPEIGSSVDYDKMTSAEQGFYFIGHDLSGLLKQKCKELIGEYNAGPQEVEVVMRRKLQVPLGANGCAYFRFEDLCDKPLGAADYFGLFSWIGFFWTV